MKKILFTLVTACFSALPLVAQNNVYYQKVPKLIPQADGSYRVDTDEFYFVPVSPAATPTATVPQSAEPDNLGTIIEQKPVSVVVEKNKNLPGKRPYISIGLAGMRSTGRLNEEGIENRTLIKDVKPALKIAFGGRLSSYVRLEAFYQYRDKISDTWEDLNVSTKMQDLGANLFIYANPQDKTRFFIGAGIAATRVQPKVEFLGYDVTSQFVFSSKWFATPSFFVGIETPISAKTDVDITAFYSHTNIHKDGVQCIESYGLAVNLRFNLPEHTLTYVK